MTRTAIRGWSLRMVVLCSACAGLTDCDIHGLNSNLVGPPIVEWKNVFVYVYPAPQNFVEVLNENGGIVRNVDIEFSIWDSSASDYVVRFTGTVSTRGKGEKATVKDFACECKTGDRVQIRLDMKLVKNGPVHTYWAQPTL